ncbi:MAG TPA: hypothetical protein VFI12_04080, partial [Thermomicrobiales bacterium]|nr:hypothetical protein [Thermomicrobiales bacterium]
MAFIMNGLDAENYSRTYTDRQLIDRIKTYFRPEAAKIGLVTVMVVLKSVFDAALPILIATGLDRVVGPDGVDNRVWWLVVGIIVFGALSWGVNFVQQFKSAEIVGNIILRLRTDA